MRRCRRAGPRSCCAAPCCRASPRRRRAAGRLGRRARRLAAAHGRGGCGADAGPVGRRRAITRRAWSRSRVADRARHRRSCGALPAGRRRRASLSHEPVWPLADGMCAALRGRIGAGERADRSGARPAAGRAIDLQLAEKVVGAGAETRRAVDIHWDRRQPDHALALRPRQRDRAARSPTG